MKSPVTQGMSLGLLLVSEIGGEVWAHDLHPPFGEGIRRRTFHMAAGHICWPVSLLGAAQTSGCFREGTKKQTHSGFKVDLPRREAFAAQGAWNRLCGQQAVV